MRTSIRNARPILVAVCLLVFAGWADVTFNPDGNDAVLATHSSLRGASASHAIAASCKRHDGQTRGEFSLPAAAPAYRLRFAESMDYAVLSASNHSAKYLFSTRGPPLS
jgi:hypothetical protein